MAQYKFSRRYRMEDGTIIDTANSSLSWEELQDWDGENHIGRASKSWMLSQMLFRSRRGRYYVEHRTRMSGDKEWCEWVSKEEAARWLLLNEYELPNDLKEAAERVSE